MHWLRNNQIRCIFVHLIIDVVSREMETQKNESNLKVTKVFARRPRVVPVIRATLFSNRPAILTFLCYPRRLDLFMSAIILSQSLFRILFSC